MMNRDRKKPAPTGNVGVGKLELRPGGQSDIIVTKLKAKTSVVDYLERHFRRASAGFLVISRNKAHRLGCINFNRYAKCGGFKRFSPSERKRLERWTSQPEIYFKLATFT